MYLGNAVMSYLYYTFPQSVHIPMLLLRPSMADGTSSKFILDFCKHL